MPDSNFFWDPLIQLIDERKVVPVVGQDLLTVPETTGHTHLYPYLATRLAAYLDVNAADLPAGGELNEVACRYLSKGKPIQRIYAALKTVAAEAESLPPPEPLLQLAAIRPLQLFVTTTFDSSLPRALDQTRFGGQAKTCVFAHAPHDIRICPISRASALRWCITSSGSCRRRRPMSSPTRTSSNSSIRCNPKRAAPYSSSTS